MRHTAIGKQHIPLHHVRLRSSRGTAELLSTLMAVPLFAVFIALLMYFGQALYARAAIEDAAIAGARFAVTSMSGDKGCQQTRAVIAQVLAGYGANLKAVTWQVTPLDGDYKHSRSRNEQIQIEMSYLVKQSGVPIFGAMLGDYTAQTRYVLVVDRNANRYWYGWTPCYAEKFKGTKPF